MKRAFLPLVAAGLLFVTSCGDATTEKTSHGTTDREVDGSEQSGMGTNEGLDDTLSTNATLPGSAAPSGGGSSTTTE
jgi:hypothetical protein